MLTIAPGYDPRYLTRQVGQGAENYYLSAVAEHGEPPGIWWGAGAEELGLEPGSEIDAATMEKLYSTFVDPRDPDFLRRDVDDDDKQRLGRRPPKFGRSIEASWQARLEAEPDADPERQAQIRREVLGDARQAVMHHDATFSPPKSVTLLHAGLQAAAVKAREAGQLEAAQAYEAQAAKVWDAVDAGAAASLSYLQRHAGVARRGSHSQVIDGRSTGKWIDASDGFFVARFRQHTNREGDPHLHIHQAIGNRQLGSDGQWSALDGRAMYRVRPGAGAMGERVMYERLVRDLGVEVVARPDGQGFEIKGVTAAQIAATSSRAAQVTGQLREQIEAYRAAYGREPSARLKWQMHQDAHRLTKAGKTKLADMPSRVEELRKWEAELTRRELEGLSRIPEATLGRFTADRAEQAAAELADLDYRRVLAAAVADAQASKATFSRYEVTRHIARHLPPYLGGMPEEHVEAFLEELTDAALAPAGPGQVRLLNAPDVVTMPKALQRSDGASVYQAPTSERYTTAAQLDTEAALLGSATTTGAPGLHPEQALAALREKCPPSVWAALLERAGLDPDGFVVERPEQALLGDQAGPAGAERTLLDDQAEAIYGILTSGRRTDALVGYAGTGKSYTVAQLAELWRAQTGGRVVGLTTAQNAAYVLAGEGMDETWNIKRWFQRLQDEKVTLQPGQLVVVDEAGMVPTADLARIQELVTAAGGKVVWSGDPAQLAAPETGGGMRHLVETAGAYELSTVLRFGQEWERDASVQLRAGAADVLGEYHAHGRLEQGTTAEMATAAQHAYLADYLDGKRSLLLAPTNEQAAELAAAVREELRGLGLVSGPGVALHDGNMAAAGDLIVARQNDQKVLIGSAERELSNRDVLRVEGVDRGTVRARLVGEDGQVSPDLIELQPGYVRAHVELAYASTVHAAQGRTVHRAYSLVDASATRNMLYVMMTRGRDGNYAFVARDAANVADLRPGPQQAAEAALLDREASPLGDQAAPEYPDMFAILRTVLERAEDSETALEAMRAEAQRPTHLGHLGGMWTGIDRDYAAEAYIRAAEQRGALSPSEAARLRADDAAGSLGRLLRQLDMSGRDAERILDQAIAARELDTADSVARVLHDRIAQAAEARGLKATAVEPSDETIAAGWTERTPHTGLAEIDEVWRAIAAEMDIRQHQLGDQAAEAPPGWLAGPLGPPPAEDVLERGEWTDRAGKVLAYREMYGVTDTVDVLGPEPSPRVPEQRAAWYAAHDALSGVRPGHTAAATLGELWTTRARYERQVAWAPPYVADQLRAAETSARERAQEATRLRAAAQAQADPEQRAALAQRANGQQVLADALADRVTVLREIHDVRREWHRGTAADRIAAMRADAELRRREDVDADRLAYLHAEHEPDIEAELDQAAVAEAARGEPIPGQLTVDGWGELPSAHQAEAQVADPEPPAARPADAEEILYQRYAMRRRVDLPPPSPGSIAEQLGVGLAEVVEIRQRWADRYEHEHEHDRQAQGQAQAAEPGPAAVPAGTSREPVREQVDVPAEDVAAEAVAPAVEEPMPGQLALDLFGLGEDAPDDPELASALEQARAARQVVQERAEQERVREADEDERAQQAAQRAERAGPAERPEIERKQERVAETREQLEQREVERQAAEAARLVMQSFPHGFNAPVNQPSRGPRPSQGPRRPPPQHGPEHGGPSMGR